MTYVLRVSQNAFLRSVYSTLGFSTTLPSVYPCESTDGSEEWIGVECDQGHVVGITLSSTNLNDLPEFPDNVLTGQLNPVIGSLTELEVLNIANNRVHGTIPPELGQLPRLRTVYLDQNQLSGTVPTELAALEKLQGRLHLHGNALNTQASADGGCAGKLPETCEVV